MTNHFTIKLEKMNPTITKLIDQYLSGELNSDELAAFKERMLNNPDLQREVQLQKSVMDAAKQLDNRQKNTERTD